MSVTGTILPGVSRLARLQVELSKRARQRLKWFDYYNLRGQNARLTCRYFGISPQTFYRWKRRYNPRHLQSFEDRSHRPQHVRQPTYSTELVQAVLKLREKYLPKADKARFGFLPDDVLGLKPYQSATRWVRWRALELAVESTPSVRQGLCSGTR